jgi:hypothetical protein
MDRDVQQDIKAMWDSVHLIDEIIAANKHDEYLDDDVRRNYKHLEIMLNKDWIIDSGEDLQPFVDCIARAKAWLGE